MAGQRMVVYVDSREPKKTSDYLKSFGAKVNRTKLDYGDVKTEQAVVESKSIGDLIGSAHGWKGAQVQGRIWDQLNPFLECPEIPFLMLHGSVTAYERKRHTKINRDAFYGLISSIIVRYGVQFVWRPTHQATLYVIFKLLQKIHEGKWMAPRWSRHRKRTGDMRAHNLSVLLKVSPRIAEGLLTQFRSIPKVFDASIGQLLSVNGVGMKTAQKIKYILREGF